MSAGMFADPIEVTRLKSSLAQDGAEALGAVGCRDVVCLRFCFCVLSFLPDVDCSVSLSDVVLTEVVDKFLLGALRLQLVHVSEATARVATVYSHAILAELATNAASSRFLHVFLMFLLGDGVSSDMGPLMSPSSAKFSPILTPSAPTVADAPIPPVDLGMTTPVKGKRTSGQSSQSKTAPSAMSGLEKRFRSRFDSKIAFLLVQRLDSLNDALAQSTACLLSDLIALHNPLVYDRLILKELLPFAGAILPPCQRTPRLLCLPIKITRRNPPSPVMVQGQARYRGLQSPGACSC